MDYKLLRSLRKSRGLTQDEVASTIGVSRQALSNYERGLREPALKCLITMANMYQVSLDELVGRKDYQTVN